MRDIPEWAIEHAVDLIVAEGVPQERGYIRGTFAARALAKLIAKHEEPPVDSLLIEAREIAALECEKNGNDVGAQQCRKGGWDDTVGLVPASLAALKRGIELGKAQ